MNTIINPKTSKPIKIGGQAHKNLITTGLLDRNTLNIGKKSIIQDSRMKRSPAHLVRYPGCKSTHWTNADDIARELDVPLFTLIKYFTKEFDELKFCYNKKRSLIIFPGYEPFIDNCIDDFVNDLLGNVNFNE